MGALLFFVLGEERGVVRKLRVDTQFMGNCSQRFAETQEINVYNDIFNHDCVEFWLADSLDAKTAGSFCVAVLWNWFVMVRHVLAILEGTMGN